MDEREEREQESRETDDTRYERLGGLEQEERERIAEEVAVDPLPDKHDHDDD
jgi:hypothetical protein